MKSDLQRKILYYEKYNKYLNVLINEKNKKLLLLFSDHNVNLSSTASLFDWKERYP